MRRAVLLGLLLAATIGGVASAETRPFDSEALHAYDIANEYWGGPPLGCSSVAMSYSTELSSDGAVGGQATVPPPGEIVPCTLEVQPGMPFYELCRVMVHEDGHLHGLGHSPDRRSIMYRFIGPLAEVSACDVAGRRRRLRELVDNARTLRLLCVELQRRHEPGVQGCYRRVSRMRHEAERLHNSL